MNVWLQAAGGILVPFLGTTAGAAAVFLKKKKRARSKDDLLSAFSAGVMLAASVWSLLLPAIAQAERSALPAFLPPALGVAAGGAFCMSIDLLIPPLKRRFETLPEQKKRTALLVWAVTVHNLPEGMAVGVLWAGVIDGNTVGASGALALSLGIALQNLPEGAIVSLPAAAGDVKPKKAFLYGVLSGAVEPAGALLTLLLTAFIGTILPYMLSFAAGAMISVAVCELIPRIGEKAPGKAGTAAFLLGFLLMMTLDVALS